VDEAPVLRESRRLDSHRRADLWRRLGEFAAASRDVEGVLRTDAEMEIDAT
jgi:hypothetical protein